MRKKSKIQLDKKLWGLLSKYIRLLRDVSEPCISCGEHKDTYHAGHYITRAKKVIKFDERNVHKQCVKCNSFLEGNSAEYRVSLINKIGLSEVKNLEEIQNNLCKFSTEWYEEKIKHYTEILKESNII